MAISSFLIMYRASALDSRIFCRTPVSIAEFLTIFFVASTRNSTTCDRVRSLRWSACTRSAERVLAFFNCALSSTVWSCGRWLHCFISSSLFCSSLSSARIQSSWQIKSWTSPMSTGVTRDEACSKSFDDNDGTTRSAVAGPRFPSVVDKVDAAGSLEGEGSKPACGLETGLRFGATTAGGLMLWVLKASALAIFLKGREISTSLPCIDGWRRRCLFIFTPKHSLDRMGRVFKGRDANACIFRHWLAMLIKDNLRVGVRVRATGVSQELIKNSQSISLTRRCLHCSYLASPSNYLPWCFSNYVDRQDLRLLFWVGSKRMRYLKATSNCWRS